MIDTDGSRWNARVFGGDGGLEQPWREGPVAALLAEAAGDTLFVASYPAAGRPVEGTTRVRAGR